MLQALQGKKRTGFYEVNDWAQTNRSLAGKLISSAHLFDHLDWTDTFLNLDQPIGAEILAKKFVNLRRGSGVSVGEQSVHLGHLEAACLVGAQRGPESVCGEGDFCQNNWKLWRKLRSISFARLSSFKSHLGQPACQSATNRKCDGKSSLKNCSNELNWTQTELDENNNQPENNYQLINNRTETETGNGTNKNGTKSGTKCGLQSVTAQDGVTVCTLGVGSTFGATVKPGKLHSVSVVTNEECTLLRVRRADFQEILEEQSQLASDTDSTPFFASSLGSRANSLTTMNQPGQQQQQQLSGQRRALGVRRLSSTSPLGQSLSQAQAQAQAAAHAAASLRRRLSLAPEPRPREALGATSGRLQQPLGRRQSVAAGGQWTGDNERQAHAQTQTAATLKGRQQSPAAEPAPKPEASRGGGREPSRAGELGKTGARQQVTPTGSCLPQETRTAQLQAAEKARPEVEPEVGAEAELGAHLGARGGDEEDAEGELGAEMEELTGLESLEADSRELARQLVRAGWVLRALLLAAGLVHDRLVSPGQLADERLRQRDSLNSRTRASTTSAQLQGRAGSGGGGSGSGGQQEAWGAAASGQSAGAAGAPQQQQQLPAQASSLGTKTQAAGRKVASYVASSFMRGSASSVGGALGVAHTTGGASERRPKSSSSSEQGPRQRPQSASFRAAGGSSGSSASSSWLAEGASSDLQQAAAHVEPVRLARSLVGRQMVDWLLGLARQELGPPQNQQAAGRFVGSRLQAVSMWQVLLEQGVLVALPWQQEQPESLGAADKLCQFCDDSCAFYRFCFDEQPTSGRNSSHTPDQSLGAAPTSAHTSAPTPSQAQLEAARESLWWALKVVAKLTPDACFRLILSKRPNERSCDEIDMVFEELQHLKALGHLTNTVKKQLSACVQSEHHPKQNTVIFNQGDAGHSWYIILRGSVNVVIVGKGVVCTLHEGDDFGKLALVNDAPRAATIVTNEPNCYFLRVDKHNFNTILRDVEANTVRLKEHGKYPMEWALSRRHCGCNAAAMRQRCSMRAALSARKLPSN